MPTSAQSVLLLADPGAPGALAESLSISLPDALAGWDVSVRLDPYPFDEQAKLTRVIEALDPASEAQDIVLYLTDLPRRDGNRPVLADISLQHRFGLISVVGVGGIFIGRRVSVLVHSAIAEVVREPGQRPRPIKRLLRMQDGDEVRYVAPKGFGRVRLLTGMVYANRPWRLAAGLSRVLIAAFATGVASLAYPTLWQLSDTMGAWRLGAATLIASASMLAWLILDHKLWERPDSAGKRDRARLYNLATLITLTIGIAVLHIGLFLLLICTALWALPPHLLVQNLGHPIKPSTYLLLAWLVAAVATLGAALGSGLEDDKAVKAAAYGVRQRQRFDKSS